MRVSGKNFLGLLLYFTLPLSNRVSWQESSMRISIPSYPPQQLSRLLSSSLLKETHQPQTEIDISTNTENRTPITRVKTSRPKPLDDAGKKENTAEGLPTLKLLTHGYLHRIICIQSRPFIFSCYELYLFSIAQRFFEDVPA